MPDQKRALIVFAKVPQPNKVKTRLTTLLTPQEAADLYGAFLRDAVDAYGTLGVDVRLYFSPSNEEIPADLQPAGISVHEQRGDGLGARMAAAFAETFVTGYEEAVIIGTDHPTLPLAFVFQSYQALVEPQAIVIGPSEDGGYYLLGMNSFFPQVFHGMTYSHNRVFADTMERVKATVADVHVLPGWYDVDDPETLERLAQDIKGSDATLTRTRKVLDTLKQSYPELV